MRDSYPEPGLQEQALRELTLGELSTIEAVLQPEQQGGVWGGIIHEERQTRDEQMETFWKLPDMPPSEKEEYLGAYHFFNDAREQNLQGSPITEVELDQFPIQRQAVRQQSERLADNLPRETCALFEGKERAARFIQANLERVLLAPRVHARRNYAAAQNALFMNVVPQKPSETNPNTFVVDEDRVTRKHFEAAVQSKQDLPYEIKPYDFFKLNNKQKNVILTEFFGEVQALAAMTGQASLSKQLLSFSKNRHHLPLAYLSPLHLREIIRDYPNVGTEMLYRTYFETPRHLSNATSTFETLQQEAEQRQAALRAKAEPALIEQRRKAAELAALSPNDQEIMKLLQDEEVNPNVLGLQPGGSIGITEIDKIMPGNQFERVVEKHIQLLGRSLYGSLPEHSASGVDLHTTWYNPAQNVGARLRDKSLGALRNLRITWAPMTTEEIQEYFKSNYDPRKHADEAVMKLVVAAEIKNAGIAKVIPVSVETVVSAQRMPKGKDRIVKITRGRVEGQDAVESRHWDAMARADTLFRINYSRPHLTHPMGYGAHTRGLNRSQ